MDWALITVIVVVVGVVTWVLRRRVLAGGVPAIPATPDELLAGGVGFGDLNVRFGDASGAVFPGPRARAWAYGVLYEEGVDADADPRYAVSLLLRAEPKLTRPAAEALVRAML